MNRFSLGWKITIFLPLFLSTLWIKQLGGFEKADLFFYDLWHHFRPTETKDNRIVIVGITEKDIKLSRKYPFSDEYLAKIIENIQKYSPTVIGLDLNRDVPVPPGQKKLQKVLNSPNLVIAGRFGFGNAPAAFLPSASIQADISRIIDIDSSIRRVFLFPNRKNSVQNFDLAIALIQLKAQGIKPQANPYGWLQFKNTVFPPLSPQAGGYATSSIEGYQMLVNWRKSDQPFQFISVSDILLGKFSPSLFTHKIVLIGTTAASLKDNLHAPLHNPPTSIYGVEVHAHAISQILSAVLDDRPLLSAASLKLQIRLLLAIALFSTVLLSLNNPNTLTKLCIQQGLATIFSLLVATLGVGYAFIGIHLWLPLAPSWFFITIYGALSSLVKINSFHLNTLKTEIERVTSELQEANQRMLDRSLQDTAHQISDALVREISPIIQDLSLQVDLAHQLYNDSIPSERLSDLEDSLDQIRHLIEYAMPSVPEKEGVIYCSRYWIWLNSSLRLAIGYRKQRALIADHINFMVFCDPALEDRTLVLPHHLQVVVIALLDNAIDACLKKLQEIDGEIQSFFHIRLFSEVKDDFLTIGVEDNGQNLSDIMLKDMFKPFTTTKSGFGLGLYVSNEIIKQSGGTVSYQKNRDNKQFIVKIPLKFSE